MDAVIENLRIFIIFVFLFKTGITCCLTISFFIDVMFSIYLH